MVFKTRNVFGEKARVNYHSRLQSIGYKTLRIKIMSLIFYCEILLCDLNGFRAKDIQRNPLYRLFVFILFAIVLGVIGL